MNALTRGAAKLLLALHIPAFIACADAGPGGPGEPLPDAGAQFAGLLTVSEGANADAVQGEAFRGAAALRGARIDLVADGGTVATVHTSGTGAFSSALASGAYTVSIAMSQGPPLEFALDLPAGGALFAEGRVDRTPGGAYSLNVRVFRDGNADARPDDSFRIQILDRVQGELASGFQDVVGSQEETEELVTLCHVPPGNPNAAHTITVGAPAVAVHLAHGDTESACSSEVPPADEGEEDEESEEETESEEGDEDAGQPRVLVCHVPPGNPENPVTIEIAAPAVPAHLAHGDTEGACEGDTGPADDEGEETEEDPESEELDEGPGQPRVLVCHVPPGNPGNPVTIEIAAPAVPAHLAHGDSEGPCPGDTGPADEEEEEEEEEEG